MSGSTCIVQVTTDGNLRFICIIFSVNLKDCILFYIHIIYGA